MPTPIRLAYLVSHPIQYQAPLLRRIAREPGIELTVFFGSDFSARSYRDAGFGVEVAWDVPLLEGYRSRILPALRDNGTVSATTPLSRGLLGALRDSQGKPAFDAFWTHGYASLNALHGIAAARVLGIPVLLRAEGWSGDRPRSGPRQLAKRAFFRVLRPAIAATLPIGSRNAAYWRETLGADVRQFPMPYAVDNAFFASRAAEAAGQAARIRQELGIPAQTPVILFASKLQKRKHASDLLQALSQLAGKLREGPALIIVGDGEETGPLQQQVREARLAHVYFAGFQNQSALPAYFALADVFVLPSQHEPWGLIVNEAMAAGCAVVVSSDVGAAPDLVRDGVNGFVYPFGDVGALTHAIAKVLQTPGVSQRMGQASAEMIRTWDFEADIRGLREALHFVTHRALEHKAGVPA